MYTYVILMFCFLSGQSSAQEGSNLGFGEYGPSKYSKRVVVVNWNTSEGRNRLASSSHSQDFYQLAHFFSPQNYPTFCGIASSTIVLNAMRVSNGTVPKNAQLDMPLPKVWGGKAVSYKLYTQENFFTGKTERVKSRAVISLKNITPDNQDNELAFRPGLSLNELRKMLEAHEVLVDMISADKIAGVELFRNHLMSHLNDSTHFIIANFHGRGLGLNSGGHIVPIAAFDQNSDSLLILDVASTKRPWIWVPVTDFYQSMHTLDEDNYRGYLIVTDSR